MLFFYVFLNKNITEKVTSSKTNGCRSFFVTVPFAFILRCSEPGWEMPIHTVIKKKIILAKSLLLANDVRGAGLRQALCTNVVAISVPMLFLASVSRIRLWNSAMRVCQFVEEHRLVLLKRQILGLQFLLRL